MTVSSAARWPTAGPPSSEPSACPVRGESLHGLVEQEPSGLGRLDPSARGGDEVQGDRFLEHQRIDRRGVERVQPLDESESQEQAFKRTSILVEHLLASDIRDATLSVT